MTPKKRIVEFLDLIHIQDIEARTECYVYDNADKTVYYAEIKHGVHVIGLYYCQSNSQLVSDLNLSWENYEKTEKHGHVWSYYYWYKILTNVASY